jgi:catechol 1,2-dioxygenase
MTMTANLSFSTHGSDVMKSAILKSSEVKELLDRVSGIDNAEGDPRVKKMLRRLVADLYQLIDDFDVTPEEFWSALAFLQTGAAEFGLIAPGLGFDRFLDIRMDLADAKKGRKGGTPRTIEGPLYVPCAPQSAGKARLDDGTDFGETLMMHGTVRDPSGRAIAGAVVDVWHCNTQGGYSHFDPSQPAYNYRRRISTDGAGAYRFRSVVPSGYGVPPGGATDRLLKAVGRHGRRPAHIHFFVSAPGFCYLTTQVNIDGDPYLHDDFAHATRKELIVQTVRRDRTKTDDPDLPPKFSEIDFNFVLRPSADEAETQLSIRRRSSGSA